MSESCYKYLHGRTDWSMSLHMASSKTLVDIQDLTRPVILLCTFKFRLCSFGQFSAFLVSSFTMDSPWAGLKVTFCFSCCKAKDTQRTKTYYV